MPKPTPGDRLDAVVPELDRLVAEAHSIRGHRHFDELEERANAIADQIRGAFRG